MRCELRVPLTWYTPLPACFHPYDTSVPDRRKQQHVCIVVPEPVCWFRCTMHSVFLFKVYVFGIQHMCRLHIQVRRHTSLRLPLWLKSANCLISFPPDRPSRQVVGYARTSNDSWWRPRLNMLCSKTDCSAMLNRLENSSTRLQHQQRESTRQ